MLWLLREWMPGVEPRVNQAHKVQHGIPVARGHRLIPSVSGFLLWLGEGALTGTLSVYLCSLLLYLYSLGPSLPPQEHHCLLGFRMRRLYFSVISFLGFVLVDRLGRPGASGPGELFYRSNGVDPRWPMAWSGKALRAGEVPRCSLTETLL